MHLCLPNVASFFRIVFSDLNLYKAVLVVPDIYNRGHLRELMTLMLTKMGFGSCFLVQVSYGTVRHSWSFLILMEFTLGSCGSYIRCRARIRMCGRCGRSKNVRLLCRRWNLTPKYESKWQSPFHANLNCWHGSLIWILPGSIRIWWCGCDSGVPLVTEKECFSIQRIRREAATGRNPNEKFKRGILPRQFGTSHVTLGNPCRTPESSPINISSWILGYMRFRGEEFHCQTK